MKRAQQLMKGKMIKIVPVRTKRKCYTRRSTGVWKEPEHFTLQARQYALKVAEMLGSPTEHTSLEKVPQAGLSFLTPLLTRKPITPQLSVMWKMY